MRSFQLEAPLSRSLALVAVWLVIVNLFALLAFNRLNLAPDNAFEWMSPQAVTPVKQSWNVIDLHNRWDSYWYLDIAQNGYYLRGDSQANVVFFPLYPLLTAIVGPLVGGNLVLSGWMVSCLFLALAVVMLTRLTIEFHPDLDPVLPAVFLLFFPTAFFLNAVYSESLFLFLSLAVVLYARRGRFLAASAFAALASATRVAGVFLFALLAVEFIHANGWRALLTRRAWPLALAPAGAVAFFLYHWIAFGDFLLYIKAQNFYGRNFEVEASELAMRNSADLANTLLGGGFTAVTILLGIVALRRLRPSYGVYMLVSLAVALSTGTALGIARYGLVLFPIHLIGAGTRSPAGRNGWLLASGLLLAMNIICFVNHYWAD